MRTLLLITLANLIFLSDVHADCIMNIARPSLFITKAQKGKESDKNPVYVTQEGDYILTEKINCAKYKIYYSFYSSHYALDYGTGEVRIEFYHNDRLIDSKIFSIKKQITNWRDLNKVDTMEYFNGDIQVPGEWNIMKLFVKPGNWAVIIKDLKITGE